MPIRFNAGARIVALTVAITLFAATMTSAQSLDATPAPAKATLLNSAAFNRLVNQPQTEVARTPVVADSPRPGLVRQVTAAMAREAKATSAKTQQGSWVSRHKAIAGVLIGVGVFFGLIGLAALATWEG